MIGAIALPPHQSSCLSKPTSYLSFTVWGLSWQIMSGQAEPSQVTLSRTSAITAHLGRRHVSHRQRSHPPRRQQLPFDEPDHLCTHIRVDIFRHGVGHAQEIDACSHLDTHAEVQISGRFGSDRAVSTFKWALRMGRPPSLTHVRSHLDALAVWVTRGEVAAWIAGCAFHLCVSPVTTIRPVP
jgi:hypothetical protein